MKKITLVLCSLLYMLMSTSTNAQWLRTGLNGRTINCLAANGTNIFAGDSVGIFLSTDNGGSWTMVDSGLPGYPVQSLLINGTNLFAGTNVGVFLSKDNGTSWNEVDSGLIYHYSGVTSFTLSDTNIYVGSNGHGVYLSTNNGISWTAVNNGLTDTLISSLAAIGTNIFAGTYSGGIFLSTNNGASWTAINIGLNSTFVTSLAVNGTNIFAGTANYGDVFLSTDSGANWIEVNNGMTSHANPNSLLVSEANIFAGTEFGAFLSINNGSNWKAVNSGLADTIIYSLASSGTEIFAGTFAGGIWKRSLSDILAVENIPTDKNDFSIYPNPATDKLYINSSGLTGNSTITIYNLLGQTIYTMDTNRKQETVNCKPFASGIYFLQLKTESGSAVQRFVKE